MWTPVAREDGADPDPDESCNPSAPGVFSPVLRDMGRMRRIEEQTGFCFVDRQYPMRIDDVD